ncbi:hypothetical protein E6P09_01395 [Haloferax mediterranei ATCC 33500]|uniref:DUF8056 domain-containing protein n=1 Tax=Haloferax mediterranei (strain ATCC 33500 / DSM 1411 / JCM 8866 / NBRC 14739 / NCIMB 2177 / R-4) TaxID=523841 RepID=I3R693_HALMT|nr:hypothetical protein [Haloferax mediterranei]AFK19753.1 hypothetical protein HFX_2061 [Haloferax mediterranei ATCC 33500]AHZ23139.1 hypothetical protein BM92_11050 [Haloferax mediterranei ATCC 33500]EMA00075.1 hypothetical protein C439_12083 [Haloferax mediterranei ATCC 33500]MDX5987502.1 hypothetical protein [Haloferax mediterranei ATCC 33500]QCQ74001.1 hypothetical protein E6P09_01395 [Haloferax mediterranei ATCC 33500]
MADDYGGVIGAFPYAFRHSESWLFKCYVLAGAVATGIVSLLVVFGLVVLIGATAGVPGGSLTLSRSFYILVGLFIVAPLIAPILFVARRHRKTGSDRRYDLTLALSGFVFMASVYVGLVASVPAELQTPVGQTTGSVAVLFVNFLYDLPAIYGLVPPVVCALGIYGVHRLLR